MMETLYSNRPRRVPSARPSGFTLNTCCKSGELLLITGRSSSKACLKTARKQGEGLGKVARSRARFCLAAQHARDGIEPTALTWKARGCCQTFLLLRHWWNSVVQTQRRRRGCAPEWNCFKLNPPAVCFCVNKHHGHGWGLPMDTILLSGTEMRHFHILYQHSQLVLNEINPILNCTLMKMPI